MEKTGSNLLGKKRCNNIKRFCEEAEGNSVPVFSSMKSFLCSGISLREMRITSAKVAKKKCTCTWLCLFPLLMEVVQSFQNKITVIGYLPGYSFLSKPKVDEPCCPARKTDLYSCLNLMVFWTHDKKRWCSYCA